ncbi:MAG: sulfatase-like hydrolase/transferase [Bacteroidetes bacterium]|nr:sulfatase-like hydrolase/transferase [Bacteroidota bacterium]
MKKIILLIGLTATICTALILGCKHYESAKNNQTIEISQQPNLIVIMADDLGYADVGFNGCKDIPTPNIDRIAENGVMCTNAYTTYSVCSPSRAGFITGRYPQRFGYERNVQYRVNDPEMGLSKDEATLATFLKQAGYKSGVIGKWHLGAHQSNHPLNRGFDEFYGHLGGGHRYFSEELVIDDSYAAVDEPESYRTWIMRNHGHEKTDEYLTDEFSNEAVQFVVRHKDEPFFLYLSYNAPHAPMQATEKYLSRFPNIEDIKRKTYAAMVSAVDDGVGNLLNKLAELDIEENTIVIFLSDNGGPEKNNASDNGILREGKGSVYEGGFRVPFAIQYKAKFDKGVYNKPISALDIYATMAAITATPENPNKPLDGVNLIPYITGENKEVPHETIYLRKFDQNRFAVRNNDYKLVTFNNGSVKELYNLKEDISESKNIIGDFPEIANQIDTIRGEWAKQLIDPAFLGLIHTDAWQKSGKKGKKK